MAFLDETGLADFWNHILARLNNFVPAEAGKGLSSNDYTTAEKEKLAGIANSANNYTLPVATASEIGGVKSGTDIIVNSSGNVSVNNGAVTTEKLADSSITRTKLAQDALYSPFKGFDSSGTLTLSTDDIGKTIRTINGNVDYTINIARDTSIPAGAEVAVFRQQAKTINIVFGDNVRVAIPGETSYMPSPTLTIGPFTMIALKKLAADSNNDYWLVTGNVEVVS